jgi:DNA primase large subunit
MKPFLPILPFLAKYPFLKLAGKFLEFEYRNLNAILNAEGKLEREAKELGIEIVKSVLEGKKLDLHYPNAKFLCSECEVKDCKRKCEDELERFRYCEYPIYRLEEYYMHKHLAKKSIIAYIFSKIAVSKLDDVLRRKFAVREARRYREMLEKEDVEFLKIVGLDFGVRFKVAGDVFKVDVVDYLKGAVKIKADEWKLVNRRLEGGFVELTKREFVRLLEEFLRERLEEKIDVGIDIDIKIDRRFDRIELEDLKEIDAECYPPCMKKILADLKNGLNVPHSARFAIASFLLNIGVSVDKVVDIFRTSPDFDEEKTRYQVEHIAGQRGKGEEYICPSCDTMKSYGNCYADESCEGINHPVRYYKLCLKRKKQKRRSKTRRKVGKNSE